MTWHRRGAMLLLLSASGALAQSARPDTSRLRSWTTALRDTQPDGPWLLVYRTGTQRLIFVAAEHENEVRSPTFRLIDGAFKLWPVRSVILEGSASSLGPNPAELAAIAARGTSVTTTDPDGETGPAVRQAVKRGAKLYGGEADDGVIRSYARAAGIGDSDLLGFYVLRVIPQWARDGSIAGYADPRLAGLITRQLQRSRAALGVADDTLPDFAAFGGWYRRTNGKPLVGGVAQEEAGPVTDGPWPSNRIGAAIAKGRDTHLLRQIGERLNADRSVLVVFGGSHAIVLRPALDASLGRPCYVGVNLRRAAARCARPQPRRG